MSLVHLVVEDESARETSAVSVLDELVDRLGEGQSHIVGISGPIGSGRSFALRHAVSRANSLGLGVTFAPCPPSESRIPYAVVTRLLSELLPSERIADLAVTCERAPCAADLNAVLCREFAELAARTPLLVAVDDLHWADRWSRAWFAEMAERVPESPILLLGTAHGPLERVVRTAAPIQLRLPALSVADTADLLSKATGTPVEATVARAANRAAMGRPAIVAAVAEHFAADGLPLVPARLAEVYELARTTWAERIARVVRTLPVDAVALLRAMAVGGRGFGFEMTAALAQPRSAGVLDALEILVDAGLVTGSTSPSLSCPSVAVDAFSGRDAAERAVLSQRAAELGRAVGMGALTVAELLNGVPVAGQEWVGEVFAEASECLLREGKRTQAVSTLRRALREPMAEDRRAQLLLRLAGLEVHDAPAASDGRLRQVLLGHRGPDCWPHAVEAADLLLSRGDAETARRLISDAHREARPEKSRAALAPLAALGWLAQDEAGPDLETPAAVLPAPEWEPQDAAEAAVLAWQLASRAEDRPRTLELARAALAADGEAPLMCLLAAARSLMCADEFGEAYAGSEQVLRLARRRGARAAAAQALLTQAGLVLRRGGDPAQALAGIEAAKRELPLESWHPALGSKVTAAEIMANVRCGRLGAARLLAGRQTAWPADQGAGWSYLLFAKAELLLVGGEPERALVLFEECGRVLLSRGWRNPMLLPWRFGASLAHQLLGAAGTALALRAEEDAVLERWGVAEALELPGERALAAFRAIGVDIPDLPVLAAAPEPAADALTALAPGEREVVRLLLSGRANGEAAAELGVTRRTVELRLTKVYRKLGVRGRDELLARLGGQVGAR